MMDKKNLSELLNKLVGSSSLFEPDMIETNFVLLSEILENENRENWVYIFAFFLHAMVVTCTL